MSILFNNLSCKLGDRKILDDLSGKIDPGKMTAVLGPNGCGKSTFLRALLGLVPVSGKISALPASTGYLPQAKEIYWPLTCEAIVDLSATSHEPRSTKNSDQILNRLNISYLRDKRIDEISGGERTLVLLARALRDQPQLIITDEPVSELDPAYQIKVMKILKEEANRGALVLTTMHDISLTAKYCDRVMLMKDGRILKQGLTSEVLTGINLTQIFGIPFSTKNGADLSPDVD